MCWEEFNVVFECLFLYHGVNSIVDRKSKEITLITTRENREIII